MSEEPCIIWLSFVVHKCKMIISLGFFFFYFFQILIFWVVKRVKGQKMTQHDKKFCLTLYLRNCTSYDCGFCLLHVKCSNLNLLEFIENCSIFSKTIFLIGFKGYYWMHVNLADFLLRLEFHGIHFRTSVIFNIY